ncbi:MAG: alpha amylase C-terminal domain-containing protein [Lentisphaerae bacterium]|nr:alpha amylase C-terminal domain-containing protein [Lentisphaerota bacterium]
MQHTLKQDPRPGSHLVRHRGDTMEFVLELESDHEGNAWLRTNLCSAAQCRREIVRHVEFGEPMVGAGWHDVPMSRIDGRRFRSDQARFGGQGKIAPDQRFFTERDLCEGRVRNRIHVYLPARTALVLEHVES